MSVKNRTVIVTGASQGIGRAIALEMAEAGANVALVSRNEQKMREVEEYIKHKNGNCIVIPTDVTSEEEVDQMVEQVVRQFETVDILVNNAGDSGPTAPVHELSKDEWHGVIDSSLTGSFLCIKSVVPYMIEQDFGRIINMSSVAGKAGLPYRVGYSSAKAGIIGMTRGLALELGPHNICINAIVPGAVAGERLDYVISEQARQRGVEKEALEEILLQDYPLRRVVEAEDIARLTLFLAGEGGANITGEDINVTAGGMIG